MIYRLSGAHIAAGFRRPLLAAGSTTRWDGRGDRGDGVFYIQRDNRTRRWRCHTASHGDTRRRRTAGRKIYPAFHLSHNYQIYHTKQRRNKSTHGGSDGNKNEANRTHSYKNTLQSTHVRGNSLQEIVTRSCKGNILSRRAIPLKHIYT